MKSLFLASAAAAALFAEPALAQSAGPVGSVGVSYGNTEVEFGGVEADQDSYALDGTVALPAFGDWTVTLGAQAAQADDGIDDETAFSGTAHLTKVVGGDLRVGGFIGATDAGDETAYSVGAEVQKYLAGSTLTGSVAYSSAEDSDADIWSVGGDMAFYPLSNLRVNVGGSYNKIEVLDEDADAYLLGVGAEYQISSTPFSVTAGYTLGEVEDLELNTWTIGLRYSFGGGLQARDRAGANLTGTGVTSLLGAL